MSTPQLTILKRTATLLTDATWATIPWDSTVQDDVAAYNSGASTTNIVVPTGYTRARVTLVTAHTISPASCYVYCNVIYNGTTIRASILGVSTPSTHANGLSTGWITVAATEIFTAQALSIFGSNGANVSSGIATGDTKIQIEWGN